MKLWPLPVVLTMVLLVGPRLVSQAEKPQAVEKTPVMEALKKYLLEKDYPERFKDISYHVRVENISEVDIDNDGKKELVVQFFPHYRQSASVVIYKVSDKYEITRVTEALAPGRLQKISGEYLDSHEAGLGVDFTIDYGKSSPEGKDKVLQSAFSNFGGVVAYHSFYHADGRKGLVSYIDMTGVQLPSNAKDCSSFEFSKIRQIAAGHLREDSSKNYLAAWVGDEVYVYLIRGISDRGMLDKKLWVVNAPANFKGFIPGQGLAYETASGTTLLTLAN
jgi:hypothetical protein